MQKPERLLQVAVEPLVRFLFFHEQGRKAVTAVPVKANGFTFEELERLLKGFGYESGRVGCAHQRIDKTTNGGHGPPYF